MFIEWLATSLPLADTEVGFIGTLLSQIWLWARVAFGIGLVIFVHELGHFLAAKTFGVKCEKFYVGFDVPINIGPIKLPRTLGKFTYGETEYGIGILPLGGYVKMLGQDDDPRKAQEEADRIKMESDGEDEDAEPELDPRSYPAKPVWQRMIIISAGVVVNVITGILFAAIAFGYGVSYNPAIIGGVTPGGPAWEAGIEPGGQVTSVGDLKDDELHFREMRIAILTAGLDKPDEPIDIGIKYDDDEKDIPLKTAPHPLDGDMRMIGITSPTSTKLSKTFAQPESAAAAVLTEEDAKAKIVGYDGKKIDDSMIVPGTPLFHYLNSNPTKTIKLDLERADGSTHTVDLAPQKAKSLGFEFGAGPIVALQSGGAAEKAGVKVGDVLTSVNDKKTVSAMQLPIEVTTITGPLKISVQRRPAKELHHMAAKVVAVSKTQAPIARNQRSDWRRIPSIHQPETVDIEIPPSASLQTLPPTSGSGGEIALNKYGFAYLPTATVSEVDGDTGLQPGDLIKEARMRPSEELEKRLEKDGDAQVTERMKAWKFDQPNSITWFLENLQIMPDGTEFIVIAERPAEDNKVIEATLKVRTSDSFRFERGLALTAAEQTQTARSFGHALSLGLREGKRRLGDVFRFLGMLVRGRVKSKQVGGPIRIVQLAGAEAERGISPQLLFLTMLSMNLAILNFLPIPALDGGHMVFLIAEAIRGKRVDEQLEMRLTLVGVLALLSLMAFVFLNDIIHF